MKTGETKQTHIFTMDRERSQTTVFKKNDRDAVEKVDNLLPTRRNKIAVFRSPEERAPLIRNLLTELKNLDPPGLNKEKQVELYSKWRPLLKPENRERTCPKPSDEIIERVKKTKKERRIKRKRSPR